MSNKEIAALTLATLPVNFLHTGSQDSCEIAVYDTAKKMGLGSTWQLLQHLSFSGDIKL